MTAPRPAPNAFAATLARYAQAATGPIVSAGAQFLLSLAVLRLLSPSAFGSFAFLLVAAQLSWGLWSALFCAPLPILLSSGTAGERAAADRCLLATNLAIAALAMPLFCALALALRVPAAAAIVFAGYGSVALLRWFARAHAYATGRPLRTMASDLSYSAALLAGAALMVAAGAASLHLVYATLLVGAVIGMMPFGAAYLSAQFVRVAPRAIGDYGAVWRRHSGWSLLGVLTTEATANSHAYIITALYGPAAFAPIAASALLIRPVGVAMNALTEFERAQMARQIGARRIAEAIGSVRVFRLVLIAVWIATAIAIGVLLAKAPRLLFPAHYDLRFLTIGALLWLAVAGIRLARTPESALLQAAGAFRPLAFASVWSSGVSIAAVLLLLAIGGPLWSIAGIGAGEAVSAIVIYVQARRWRRRELAAETVAP